MHPRVCALAASARIGVPDPEDALSPLPNKKARYTAQPFLRREIKRKHAHYAQDVVLTPLLTMVCLLLLCGEFFVDTYTIEVCSRYFSFAAVFWPVQYKPHEYPQPSTRPCRVLAWCPPTNNRPFTPTGRVRGRQLVHTCATDTIAKPKVVRLATKGPRRALWSSLHAFFCLAIHRQQTISLLLSSSFLVARLLPWPPCRWDKFSAWYCPDPGATRVAPQRRALLDDEVSTAMADETVRLGMQKEGMLKSSPSAPEAGDRDCSGCCDVSDFLVRNTKNTRRRTRLSVFVATNAGNYVRAVTEIQEVDLGIIDNIPGSCLRYAQQPRINHTARRMSHTSRPDNRNLSFGSPT